MNDGLAGTTQTKTHELAHGVALGLDNFRLHVLGQGEVTDRIEILNRKFELLTEELECVWQVCTTTSNHDPLGGTATVLAAIIVGGASDFRG